MDVARKNIVMVQCLFILLKKCVAAGSVLVCLQFLISNVALSGDPRSQNKDTLPQKEVTNSAPSPALAGEYDGERSGIGVLDCTRQNFVLHMRFIVAGSSFEGNFGEGVVEGSLEFDAIKGRAWG